MRLPTIFCTCFYAKALTLVTLLASVTFPALAQTSITYSTGGANWNDGSAKGNAGDFDFTGGVGLWSADGNVAWGMDSWRPLTTGGSLSGTALSLQVGQSISITITGADSGGRTGITTSGAIGFSLATGTGAPSGATTAAQAIDGSRFRVEYVGGDNSATAVGGATTSAGMPGFSSFKSGQTYIVELISSNQINFRVVGATQYNILDLGSSGNIGKIVLYNRGSNMDARFTGVVVTNMTAVTLSNNVADPVGNISGQIGKNNGTNNNVIKNGDGTVALTTSNSYGGTTAINAGILRAGANGALGGAGAGTVTVASGATLALNNASTVSNALSIAGTGAGGIGAIHNDVGDVTVSGAVTLTAASSIKSSNNTLTFSGGFSGAGLGLTINGDGNTTISSTGINTGSSGTLTKNDNGTLIISAAGNFTGSTTINNGIVRIANNTSLGTTAGATTLSAGALELSNNITVGENISLSGTGVSSGGALRNASGTNTWTGAITNTSGARINADTNTALIISGNISNAASQTLYLGGNGNITNTGTITGTLTTGNGAVFKDGSGTLTLSANNSGLTGLFRMRQGTVSITNANSLGSGSLEFGDSDTTNNRITLLINSNTTIANRFAIANNSGGGTIDVASGQTATFTGVLSQTNGTANTTKIAKGGAGILILGGTGSTYAGQIQIGNGTVIIGQSGSFGTNTTIAQRGIDLGLDISDANQANNVSLLTSNNVTISNSIYVAPNTSSATRTIGIAGPGTAGFSNEIRLDQNTTLTVNAGSASSDRVNISGAITQNTGTASGIIKQGAGTLALSGANTYSGNTTIDAGTLRLERLSGGVGATAINGNTIAVNNGGTLLLGAANQIGDNTGITLAGGILDTAGYADQVGQLKFSGSNVSSTIIGLSSSSNGFLFSGLDTASIGSLADSGLIFRPSEGNLYSTVNGLSIKLSNADWVAAAGGSTTLNGFNSKISFADGTLASQISFSGGQSGTYLNVAAIPEPKVYVAAGALALLIGLAEFRRRKKIVSSKV